LIAVDLALARRLESAEGAGCRSFAEARGGSSTACAIGGGVAVFDGADSPLTQAFALGLFEPLTGAILDATERFFDEHQAPVMLEICPLVGVEALQLLCQRGYRPIEISSVLMRPLENLPAPPVNVRLIGTEEFELWTRVSAGAWLHEHPELESFFVESGRLFAQRDGSANFLAETGGQPAATGSLFLHGDVALLAGASTLPEWRRRGLQADLLAARLHHAAGQGASLAMMVAEAGSQSQRNAQRRGFHIAYTRLKWRRESSS
jgi:GNAT superfamily N-acetyltransferase